MKKGKRIFYIGLALWLIAFFQLLEQHSHSSDEENKLVTAFSSASYLSTESRLSATATLPAGEMTTEEIQALLSRLARSLGVSSGMSFDHKDDDSASISTLSGETEYFTCSFHLISGEKNKLELSLSFPDSFTRAFEYRVLLQMIFEADSISADIHLSLSGTMRGDLSLSDKTMLADHLIQKAGGRIVTESRREDCFVIYAYTDEIAEYRLSGSMKINLNLVITYDETKDCTVVSLSTPFLNEDF